MHMQVSPDKVQDMMLSCQVMLRSLGHAPLSPYSTVADLAAVFDSMPLTGVCSAVESWCVPQQA